MERRRIPAVEGSNSAAAVGEVSRDGGRGCGSVLCSSAANVVAAVPITLCKAPCGVVTGAVSTGVMPRSGKGVGFSVGAVGRGRRPSRAPPCAVGAAASPPLLFCSGGDDRGDDFDPSASVCTSDGVHCVFSGSSSKNTSASVSLLLVQEPLLDAVEYAVVIFALPARASVVDARSFEVPSARADKTPPEAAPIPWRATYAVADVGEEQLCKLLPLIPANGCVDCRPCFIGREPREVCESPEGAARVPLQ
jgi:hypothetical protein